MKRDDYLLLKNSIPKKPGVYKFIDGDGTILYVGKAKDLSRRVSNYFQPNNNTRKIELMVFNSAMLDYTIVDSEQEALLLENTLIKHFQPRYNVMLKDDKTYPYICIKKENFPRVFLTRRLIRDGSEYFGPYASMHQTEAILGFIKKIVPLRTCNLALTAENIEKKKFKVCLEYHIKNCLGPCENYQSEKSYDEGIARIRKILSGHIFSVMQELKERMKKAVEEMKFEDAHDLKMKLHSLEEYQARSTVANPRIRDADVFSVADYENNCYVNYLKVVNGNVVHTKTIELAKRIDEDPKELLAYAVNELRSQFHSRAREVIVPFRFPFAGIDFKQTVPKINDKKKLLELSEKNVQYYRLVRHPDLEKPAAPAKEKTLNFLKEDFHLAELPLHIECFDNSNMQGSNPVASCVVFREAKPARSEYRHFNIKTVEGPDDFASMREIVFRRYRRLLDENKPLPQLVMIDGGKGQLSAAMESIDELGLRGKFAVAGIAKRLEEIYMPGDSVPLHISKRSPSLKLIQQIRNEAHRFAITFHKKKRSKQAVGSALTGVKGIGEKTATALIKHFGSVDQLRKANPADVVALIGKARANILAKFFSK